MDEIKNEGVWDLRELEKAEDKISKPTQWANIGPRTYKGVTSTHPRLLAGAYNVTLDRNDGSAVFIRRDIKTDEIIRFKDSLADSILSEITTFWGEGDKFKKLGFLHRRGYLLYGSQGTGKSSVVQQVMAEVIANDGVVLICDNPKFFNIALTTFRQAEPNRPLVAIFEDIDAIIKRHGEDEILSILDGSNMVDKVLNIATTNYPEFLDKRIVSRPRRFDRVIKILPPTEEVRSEYLTLKLPKKTKAKELAEWVRSTEGLSFAGMSEAIISVYCLGNSFEDTIRVLTDIENGHPNSQDFGTKVPVGFGVGGDDEDSTVGLQSSPGRSRRSANF